MQNPRDLRKYSTSKVMQDLEQNKHCALIYILEVLGPGPGGFCGRATVDYHFRMIAVRSHQKSLTPFWGRFVIMSV